MLAEVLPQAHPRAHPQPEAPGGVDRQHLLEGPLQMRIKYVVQQVNLHGFCIIFRLAFDLRSDIILVHAAHQIGHGKHLLMIDSNIIIYV